MKRGRKEQQFQMCGVLITGKLEASNPEPGEDVRGIHQPCKLQAVWTRIR